MKQIYTFIFFILFSSLKINAQRVPIDQIKRVVSYLASDEMGGRAVSTSDEMIAAKFIAEQFDMMQLEPKGTKWFYSDFKYKHNNNIHDTIKADVPYKMGRNVVAFLDNDAEYTVVIGAHYDHLGMGHDHNSLEANPEGKIHNGADDNASGVAGVLALAHYFSTNGYKEKYNFLFMTFSGEELGLIGSKKWCENPSYPLSNINYMINMDMIGRLNNETKKLLVYGVGTSDAFKPAIEKSNTYFSIKYDSAGVGPSDHTSFYLKDIPVLHFFTGQHSDYHKPTDDEDKVNYQGEVSVLELIIDIVNNLDNQPKVNFYHTKTSLDSKVSFKVTLGIMPDYTFEGEGVHIDGVTDNKPAFNAGIQKGDIIIQMNNKSVNNIQDYMKVLSELKKGDKTNIDVKRGGEVLNLEIQF